MRVRQIVFAAQSLEQGRDALAALFQLEPPFRDPGVAEFGIDNAVFVFGDQFIEVISPYRADTACGRHLARHGDSGYMLLLQTDDLPAARGAGPPSSGCLLKTSARRRPGRCPGLQPQVREDPLLSLVPP